MPTPSCPVKLFFWFLCYFLLGEKKFALSYPLCLLSSLWQYSRGNPLLISLSSACVLTYVKIRSFPTFYPAPLLDQSILSPPNDETYMDQSSPALPSRHPNTEKKKKKQRILLFQQRPLDATYPLHPLPVLDEISTHPPTWGAAICKLFRYAIYTGPGLARKSWSRHFRRNPMEYAIHAHSLTQSYSETRC